MVKLLNRLGRKKVAAESNTLANDHFSNIPKTSNPEWLHKSSRHLCCDDDECQVGLEATTGDEVIIRVKTIHCDDINNTNNRSSSTNTTGDDDKDDDDEMSDLTTIDDGDNNNNNNNSCLPRMDSFSSNHVLVNAARQAAGLLPLHRHARLDALARRHAVALAQQPQRPLRHSCRTVAALRQQLGGRQFVGENVLRGTSVRQMHRDTVSGQKDSGSSSSSSSNSNNNKSNARANLLSSVVDEFGMATAKDRHGRLYMVQLFCSST